MPDFDEKVLQCFLENQLKLYPEPVAQTPEEAKNYLEECMALVVNSKEEVWEYFDEEGVDMENMDANGIVEADEVFAVGDGRYLIVEG